MVFAHRRVKTIHFVHLCICLCAHNIHNMEAGKYAQLWDVERAHKKVVVQLCNFEDTNMSNTPVYGFIALFSRSMWDHAEKVFLPSVHSYQFDARIDTFEDWQCNLIVSWIMMQISHITCCSVFFFLWTRRERMWGNTTQPAWIFGQTPTWYSEAGYPLTLFLIA